MFLASNLSLASTSLLFLRMDRQLNAQSHWPPRCCSFQHPCNDTKLRSEMVTIQFATPKPPSGCQTHPAKGQLTPVLSPLSFALSSFTLRKGGSPVRRKSACPIPMSSSICLCPGCRQETDSDGDELHHELHPTNTKPRPDMAPIWTNMLQPRQNKNSLDLAQEPSGKHSGSMYFK